MGHDPGDVEVFVHSEMSGAKAIRVPAEMPLAEVLTRAGVAHLSELLIFVGEAAEALEEALEVEDGEDGHEPASPLHTVRHHAGHRRSIHVHCHRCRRVAVSVHYHRKTKGHRFSPATTVETTLEWARKKFHLHDPDDDRLVLKVHETGDQPRSDVHLGELVGGVDCTLCFDLVPDVKVEG